VQTFRRLCSITAAAVAVTAFAVAFWGVALAGIWVTVRATALGDARAAAITMSVSAVLLWCVRWLGIRLREYLGDGAITYLLDAMLSQREWMKRHWTPAAPQPTLPSPRPARHAR
jgi:hypothetical protein